MRLSRSIPIAAAVLAAAPAHAQQWGGPLFSSPLEQSRFEILSSDANGAGMGIAVAVRPFSRVADLRLRVGIMDGIGTGPFSEGMLSPGREVAYMAGIDYAMPLNPQAGGPVRASLVAGLGVGMNAETVVSAPLGFSLAYDGGSIRPYMTPRVVLEHHSGPAPYVGPWEGSAVVDWGVDVSLPVGGTLRAALTTGSYRAFGIGISF
ncbi:hypothetical protein [Longimicrobium sp.]|jgi:hypothetical protein|uniref:hypothetical protein n=1 Tax=Longimicrobium sp. TaxID=2029185 RepID=UPI002F9351BD